MPSRCQGTLVLMELRAAPLPESPPPGVCGLLAGLCRGDVAIVGSVLARAGLRELALCACVIILGGGAYGATIGVWRSPLQAAYTALKFPLVILLTCAANALLNAMLGRLLGSGLSLRQTLLLILLSFTTAALVLASLSPIFLFVALNTPAFQAGQRGVSAHSFTLLLHVSAIAAAGVIANRRLLAFLVQRARSRGRGRRVLLAWLIGNLFLGSQVAWVLRPFIGSPSLPVQLLRAQPLRGNFYEAVLHAARHL